MQITSAIDPAFDFRSDTPPGADPDKDSPTLHRYHRFLWSKELPGGAPFELTDARPLRHLRHRSALGEFFLSSDGAIPSFRKDRRILAEIPADELAEFVRLTYTIGGSMVFPGNRIAGKMTINGARGFHPLIKDRFDLTVECIRLHYSGGESPLSDTLERYREFFALFESFAGYVDFFLLQDLVMPDYSVRFFDRFDGFSITSPLPTPDAYRTYRLSATEFIAARNDRISRYASGAYGSATPPTVSR